MGEIEEVARLVETSLFSSAFFFSTTERILVGSGEDKKECRSSCFTQEIFPFAWQIRFLFWLLLLIDACWQKNRFVIAWSDLSFLRGYLLLHPLP